MIPSSRPGVPFDDHLGLMSRDFSGVRLVVLHGVSGSGKSTAIDHLLCAHPQFRGQRYGQLSGEDFSWRRLPPSEDLVVVDECAAYRDLLGLVRLLGRGHTVLAASHLPVSLSAVLAQLWPAVLLRTDGDPAKIERYLEGRRIRFSADRVRDFFLRFGASYGSVDRILDFDGGRDFDRAYDRFTRCCRVETMRNTSRNSLVSVWPSFASGWRTD